MTSDLTPETADDTDLNAIVERVLATRGGVVAVDVGRWELPALWDGLWQALDSGMDLRLVLGAACTTAARSVDQFVAALQLPYQAARSWQDLLDELAERPLWDRYWIVVADAARLLRHEEPDMWHELVRSLPLRPSCMARGWTTVVLADHDFAWERSIFGSAANAEAAAAERRW